MSIRSDDLFLVDIIESADGLTLTLQGIDCARAGNDEVIRPAVLWRLYVIGEAASRLSEAGRNRFSNIPWDQIRAFRNRMAHGYFSLEWEHVWQVVTQHISELSAQALAALNRDYPETYRILQERRHRPAALGQDDRDSLDKEEN